MKVKYVKSVAGVPEGEVRELRDDIANAMIVKGFCEQVKSVSKKEVKNDSLETKEEKITSKRRTKSKK